MFDARVDVDESTTPRCSNDTRVVRIVTAIARVKLSKKLPYVSFGGPVVEHLSQRPSSVSTQYRNCVHDIKLDEVVDAVAYAEEAMVCASARLKQVRTCCSSLILTLRAVS